VDRVYPHRLLPKAEILGGLAVSFPGHELRKRRLELNMTPETAASACAIPLGMLDALEAGLLNRLPGETYAVGFVRSYCRLLGLESEYYLSALRTANHPVRSANEARPSVFARTLRRLPIPRLPRVSSEASMWILVMVSVGAAWAGYTAMFRPHSSAEVSQTHAAELDLRLPGTLAER